MNCVATICFQKLWEKQGGGGGGERGDIAGHISGKRLNVLWSILTKHRISYPATVQTFHSSSPNHSASVSL